jgi:hypothetical protein
MQWQQKMQASLAKFMRFFNFFSAPVFVPRAFWLKCVCLQEYLKRKGKDVDPTLFEQMRGIIIQSCCQYFNTLMKK